MRLLGAAAIFKGGDGPGKHGSSTGSGRSEEQCKGK